MYVSMQTTGHWDSRKRGHTATDSGSQEGAASSDGSLLPSGTGEKGALVTAG